MCRKNKNLAVLSILALALGFFSLLNGTANAAMGVNPDISFEGKIVNSSGVNITNATYNVEFTMYTGCSNEPTNNTGCTLAWTEDYLTSATEGVPINGGTFEVNLGQYCAFSGGSCQGNTNSGINWNTYPIYMSMQIGGTTNCTPSGNFTSNCSGDGVMQPYILMTSTPYAQNASTLGGLGSGSFAQLGATQTFLGGNTFEVNSASALTVENTSSQTLLSINTSTPAVNLGVTGSLALNGTVSINNSSGGIELTTLGSTASSSATTLQGGSGNLSLTTGTAAGNITLTTNNASSSIIAKSSTNNTTALSVQNASGTSVLNVDTQNAQVDVGALSAPGSLTATQAPIAGSLTGTAGSTSYTYEITAVSANGAEESLAATETNASLANNITTHDITVNWTTNGASYYKIYRTASGGTPSSLGLVGTSTTGSFVDNGYTAGAQPPALANTGSLAVSTNYYYEVTALDDTYTTTDGIGQTTPSAQLTATTNSYNKSLTINWAPVAGARAYNVYRTTTSGTYTTDSYYTVYTNSFTDTNATATGTNTVPPTVSSAYGNDLSDNAAANITIGSGGTSTAQLYVGGSVPTSAVGSLAGIIPDTIFISGNYLYGLSSTAMQIVNISNPSKPVLMSSTAVAATSLLFTVQGSYAYVTGTNSLQIFNISNPYSPVSVSTTATAYGTDSVAIAGNYVYEVNSGANTLKIINVTNPAAPTVDGTVATFSNPQSVYIQGNYAYVATDTGSNDLQIFNISNPAAPVSVSALGTTPGPFIVYVQGSYAYVAINYGDALDILDVSNPADPYSVGTYLTGGVNAYNVYVQGRYAYVTTSGNTMQIIDISNPADPVEVGSVPVGTSPFGLSVQGRYAYVGSNIGLQIFDLGGAYIQQLQVGGEEVGTLQVDSNANVSGNESITGGLTVGTSAQITGNAGLGGNLTVAGSTDLEGITAINGVYGGYSSIGLATPTAPSITFSGTSGSAATWSYEVEAVDASGNTTAVSPVGSITTGDTDGLGTYASQTSTTTTFATPHLTYDVPSGQPFLTGMNIVVGSCSGAGTDDGTYTITSETTSTIVVSYSSGVAGETGCVIAAENNSNIVSWSPVTGAVNYYVFRTADAAGGSPSTTGFIGSTTATSLIDNANAGTATYLAQSTDSTNSFVVKTATNSTTALSVQNASGTSVLNVDTQNAQVDVGALSAPGSLTATQAPIAGTPTGSGSGTSYTYEVTAVSANGAESLASTETLASNGAVLSTNPITVKWTTNGASYYKIYRTASGGTPSSLGLVGTSTTGSFVDNGYTAGAQPPALANTGSLAVSTNYYYEVTALDDTYTTTDGIGQTTPSAQLTATTNSYNKSLTINWAPVAGARAYNVYRTTTSGTYTTDSYYTVYTNSFTDTNATATGTNTVPPTVSSAYGNDLSDNAAANITIGSGGTSTAQLYVGGQTPMLVGSLATGGQPQADYVDGSYVYVANFNSDTLQIFNIFNPDDPVLVGTSAATLQAPSSVSVSGQYAYVTNYFGNTVIVYNVANPSDPVQVGSVAVGSGTSQPAESFIQGRYLYVFNLATNTFVIVDIANPASPVVTGSVNTGLSGTFGITVRGSYAYVGGGGSDFDVINISNPYSPTVVSTVIAESNPANFSIQGNYLYVADQASNVLQIFDISNPADPIAVGSMTTGTGLVNVYADGRYVYAAGGSGSSGFLEAIDVSNPADPVLAAPIATETNNGLGYLAIQGRYAYAANESSDTLQVFNLGGAYVQQLQAGGIETGTLDVDSNANVSGDESIVGGLTVGGATEFNSNVGIGGDVVIGSGSSTNSASATAQQLYVGGESDPVFVSQSTNTNLSSPDNVAVSGDYAFVASAGNNELVSYDLASGTPVYLGENNTGLSGPNDVVVSGDYAYVTSTNNSEMVIFNISSGIPVFVSEIGTDLSLPWWLQIQGNYAYVANETSSKLVVFNISDPAKPTFEGANTDAHNTGSYGPVIQGNYAYVDSYGNNELIVYNISSGTPVYVTETSADIDYPTGMAIQGDYLYVLNAYSNKIVVFDIASGTPVLVGENSDYNLDFPVGIDLEGNYAYVASNSGTTVDVYDISSGIPVYVGANTDNNLSAPTGIAVQGNNLYVSSSNDNTLVRYNLGGEYAQQLQVGGEEVSQLQVDTNENVSGSASITGGLIVGSSAQVSGGLGVNGTLAANGSLVVDANYTALPSPTISGTSTTTTGGSLTAATYYYEITALDATGNETTPSTQVSQVTTGSTSTVTLTWAPITGAESYNVYRSTTSGVYTTDSVYATQGTVSGSSLTFTDTGSTAAITNTVPPTTTSAQVATDLSNSNLQVTIGGNGTPTGQLYVSGTVPTSAIGTVSTGSVSQPSGVAVQGSYTYVSNYGTNTFQVYNTSSPASPTLVGSTALTGGSGISIAGHYAYVIDYSTGYLFVVDISNPTNPTIVGSAVTGTNPSSIYIQGRYAYVTNTAYSSGSYTLEAFDLANPTTPIPVGTVTTGSQPYTVYVQGNYAYVTDVGSNTLQIFNISNPSAIPPALSTTATAGSDPNAVYVQGNYAYVVDTSLEEMQVFNVSNPSAPVVVGTFTTASYPNDIYVQGRYAYIVEDTHSIQIVDISNPTNPQNVGFVGTGSGVNYERASNLMVVQGRYAYMISEISTNTLQIFDLGGEYTQQLQAGGAEVGTLQVDSNASVSGGESITGGLAVGGATQLAGSVSAGSFSITDGLATPTTPTETVTCSGTCTSSYSYAVAATNSSGTSAISPNVSTSVGNATLNTTTEYVENSWSAVAGASSYNIYRVVGGSTQGLIGTVNYTTELTPTSASETGATVTLNFASAPPWAVGQGISLASFTTSSVDGTWPILSVTATSITLNRLGGTTGAITVGSGTATGLLAFYDTGQTGGSAAPTVATAGTITLQTTSTAALLVENASSIADLSVDTLDGIVIIGSNNSANTTQTLLQLNSDATLTEAASCTTSTNQGALYYNNASNNIRACINGSWQDLVSTQDLALQLFGVVPNSGTNPGDLIGASATTTPYTGGPCKVTYSSTTSVNVASCLAYSGGREVSVAAKNVPIGTVAAGDYENICLNSSGVPTAMGGASATDGLQTAANLNNSSAATLADPLLCLATIKSTTANDVNIIYDIRTFSTTIKTYGTLASATQVLGGLVGTGGAGLVANTTTATSNVVGVLVAGTNATASAGTLNVLYATTGPQWIKNTGTALQTDYIIPTTTTGYASALTATAATAYDQIGINQAGTFGATCSAATFGSTDCQQSVFTDLDIQ